MRKQNNSYLVSTKTSIGRITASNYKEAKNIAKHDFGTKCLVTRVYRVHEEKAYGKPKVVK